MLLRTHFYDLTKIGERRVSNWVNYRWFSIVYNILLGLVWYVLYAYVHILGGYNLNYCLQEWCAYGFDLNVPDQRIGLAKGPIGDTRYTKPH